METIEYVEVFRDRKEKNSVRDVQKSTRGLTRTNIGVIHILRVFAKIPRNTSFLGVISS
jgi:hypothetical protein